MTQSLCEWSLTSFFILEKKGLLCCRAACELKMPLTDLARQLDMTVSGVGYAIQRGESIALRFNYRLLE